LEQQKHPFGTTQSRAWRLIRSISWQACCVAHALPWNFVAATFIDTLQAATHSRFSKHGHACHLPCSRAFHLLKRSTSKRPLIK